MNTGEAVRLLSLLEEVAEKTRSDALHGGIAAVLHHIRACIPFDQVDAFDRYCARPEYVQFVQRMDACRESEEESFAP